MDSLKIYVLLQYWPNAIKKDCRACNIASAKNYLVGLMTVLVWKVLRKLRKKGSLNVVKVKYSLVDCKIISDYKDINLFWVQSSITLQEWCLYYDQIVRWKMFNLHFVSCKCNKTLFVTFMADLELEDGRCLKLQQNSVPWKGSSTIEPVAKARSVKWKVNL